MKTIQIKYSIENLISRVFGLFPYCTFGENETIIHPATDSSSGCYGMIVPNLTLPVDFYNGEEFLVIHGKSYTYRYLIDLYNEYKNTFSDSDFIKLLNTCIGEKTVDADAIGLGDREKYYNVPETIYLSKVQSMIDYMNNLKREYEQSEMSGYVDCKTCKTKNTFESYGGDVFIKYLKGLVGEAYDVANMCLGFVSDDNLDVRFDVPIFQTNKYLGVYDCYVNKWVPGERYYCGDIVTYNGITYVCVLNQIVQTPCDESYFLDNYVENQYYNNSGTQCQYVICGETFYVLDGGTNQYVEETVHHVECIELYLECSDVLYEYIECSGEYFHLDEGEYVPIDVCEYTTGVYDEETHTIGFDYAHFIPMTSYVQNEDEITGHVPTQDEIEGWYSSSNPYGTKYKIFVDVNYMPTEYIYPYIRFLGNFYVWDGTAYVIDDYNCGIYLLTGTNASILKEFRTSDMFLDFGSSPVIPEFGNDFLFFYKKGKTTNHSILYEENGNISRFTNSTLLPGMTATDLYAYGDVLYDIRVIPSDRVIEFYYATGVHFNAVCADMTFNELLEPIYTFEGEYLYDDVDSHGIRYVERYVYDDGSDLETLVNDGNFDYYVSNYKSDIIIKDNLTNSYLEQGVDIQYVINPNYSVQIPGYDYILTDGVTTEIGDIYKWNNSMYELYYDVTVYNYTGKPMVFHTTDDDVKTVSFTYGQGCNTYDYTFINSEYEEYVYNELDVLYNPLYKKDYLNGIAYVNSAKEGISVGRGNASAFERHVKLGECRTFEDLENFSNGGFFKMTEY